MFHAYVNEKRRDLLRFMKESAVNAPNRKAGALSFVEFQLLLTYEWDPLQKHILSWIEWLALKFTSTTLLLGAMRTKQFLRFRAGGLGATSRLALSQKREGGQRAFSNNERVCSRLIRFDTGRRDHQVHSKYAFKRLCHFFSPV